MTELSYNFYPQYVEWDGFVSPTVNQREYYILNASSTKVVLEDLGSQVLLYKDGNRIFALNHSSLELVFDVRFDLRTVKLKQNEQDAGNQFKAVRQIQLWRDSTSEVVDGSFPSRVFWQYIVPQAEVVVSSDEQTTDGRRFWASQIAKAFSKGLKISHWDENRKIEMPIPTLADYKREVDGFYGTETRFKTSRLIIKR